ncbi:ATP-binding protein [Niallia endozanthoxylica]|uniref:ATP-binding protein n=1 Tax=Niallia endozanthoxylica TaxID=2036016 RepID=UPI00168A6FE7|nr:ATP-binding protein [Niallia endozanthoxylica]
MGVPETGKSNHFVEEKTGQNMVNGKSNFIVKLSLDGTITYISKNVYMVLGYNSRELIGTHISKIMHQEDYQRVTNEWESRKEEISNLTYRMKKKDGKDFTVESTSSPISHFDSEIPEGIICFIKEAGLDKNEAENIMIESEKLKVAGQLAAGIAHEIKNPLTSIKGFIQLMKAEENPNKKYLEIMEDEIHRLDIISNELLVLAKPHKHKVSVQNFTKIVTEVIFLLEAEALKKSIQIKSVFEEQKLMILCDVHKVKQVLINILKNAIEAMDQGVITIHMAKNANHALVSVIDEGCGIPDEYLDHIGKPFFSTKATGNGLGLMICQKIITEHGGTISVQSTKMQGTTFTIKIPIAKN